MAASDNQRRQPFEDCVERCADSLYRVAFRLTSNPTLARELVQETYLNAWENIDSLKDIGKMRAWLFSILRNQYSKLIRREIKSVNTIGQLETLALDHSSPNLDGRISGLTNPQGETETLVQSALNELDDKHKLPLLLVSMEGLSVDEAANLLDLPRGTVLSRLHRARQKLKESLIRKGVRPNVSEPGNTIP